MHPLQATFATQSGEAAWAAELHRLVGRAELAAAEALLDAALAGLDGDIAALCRAASRRSVAISGWAELAEAIAAWQGAPITGLTVAIGNDPDLSFEKGVLHRPHMLLGLYTDEAFAWSRATRASLLAQCAGGEPAWAGHDADLEAWLDISGLDALNTALIHHKQRFFIREPDSGTEPAPPRYVEFVLGCWWRALRFHQAVADGAAKMALPGPLRIVSGMVDMRPGAVAAHLPPRSRKRGGTRAAEADHAGADSAASAPDMSALGLIRRNAQPVEDPRPEAGLRQRIAATAAPEPRRGLLARLFRRA